MCHGLQVDHGICAVPIIRVEDEVSVEVAGIQPGQWKTIAIASQGCFGGGHGWAGCGGEEIVEHVVCDVARYSSSLSRICQWLLASSSSTWSDTRIDTSCSPLATSTSISGMCWDLPWVSTVARMEFLNSSNSMWYRWGGG